MGDPIINVTFGAGPNYGPSLPSSTISSLRYAAANCPADGYYSILNYTSGCWPNDVVWHAAPDHTGDANGYYMLINATFQPSDFYIQTINGLCEGTTYQFAAWLLNMCSVTGILPNITMTIEKADGAVLAKYETGNIPILNPVTWEQYGFYFTLPLGVTSVVLRMRNNAPGGVGNDVGLDDITFRPAGPAIKTSIQGVASDTLLLCNGNTENLQLVAQVDSCYASPAYQWQQSTDRGRTWSNITGANRPAYTRSPMGTGTFQYRLLVAPTGNIGVGTCRTASAPLTIINATIPPTSIAVAICEGGSYAGYTRTGTYTDVFKGVSGCDSVRTVALTVKPKLATTIDTSLCAGENYNGYQISGNYVDTLVAANGCDSIRTLRLTVHPKAATIVDTTICHGNSFEGYTTSGTYRKVFPLANGCDSVRTVNLKVLPPLRPEFGPDNFVCADDSLQLSPGSFDTYLWQDGSTNPAFTVTQQGIYAVTVTTRCGNATAQIMIEERNCDLYFPSAFTPNGDGRNDVFRVLQANRLASYHLMIFNRWGQKIFETTDYRKGWNGTLNNINLPTGTFVWYCEATKQNNPKRIQLKGIVTLVR